MRTLVMLALALAMAGQARAQSVPNFTTNGRPTQSGDPISLSQTRSGFGSKLDIDHPRVLTNGALRPLANSDVVNVLDQGAKCDGTTDDTAAFNASFAAALVKPGGSAILVPAGRCVVSATLAWTITGNKSIRLRGEGRDVSEIVWSGNTDGLVVTLSSTLDGSGFSYLRTATNPSPVFHADGLSFVSAGSGIGGTALTITSNATDFAHSGGGAAPQVWLHDIGVHGTVLAGQGWHDGVTISNLPSGVRWEEGYITLAQQAPPFVGIGNCIALRGGTLDANGQPANTSSLYFLSHITVGNCDHGVDIGAGLQDIDMDYVGGGGNWAIWAKQAPGVVNGTATIRLTNSNILGYVGALHMENIDTLYMAHNEPQAFQYGTANSPFHDFLAVELVNVGSAIITANKFIGALQHGATTWTGIVITKVYDTLTAYNPTIISNNIISVIDIPVQVVGQTQTVMLVGNNINNWRSSTGGLPYYFNQGVGNVAVGNVLNGQFEAVNSFSGVQHYKGPAQFDTGSILPPGTLGSSACTIPGLQHYNSVKVLVCNGSVWTDMNGNPP